MYFVIIYFHHTIIDSQLKSVGYYCVVVITILCLHMCTFLLYIMFTVSAVVRFQFCSELRDHNSIKVLEGQQFKICVCKDKMVAQNVPYVIHLIPSTAASKETLRVYSKCVTCSAWCALDESKKHCNVNVVYIHS